MKEAVEEYPKKTMQEQLRVFLEKCTQNFQTLLLYIVYGKILGWIQKNQRKFEDNYPIELLYEFFEEFMEELCLSHYWIYEEASEEIPGDIPSEISNGI